MNRYRIHFVATFEHVVEAPTVEHAQDIAREIASMPTVAMQCPQSPVCGWNHIVPLENEDDPERS